MLSIEEYIQRSLENNLFWLRIMKEHAIFIESSLPPTEKSIALEADNFNQLFEDLLAVTIELANGSISQESLQSGIFYTQFTLEAEQITQKTTGIRINTDLTYFETNIEPISTYSNSPVNKEQEIFLLNRNILSKMNSFMGFQTDVLNSQLSCKIITEEYTAILIHVLHEGRKYINILTSLQDRELPTENNLLQDENFWNAIMSDHAKVMRGRFDPSEANLFNEANGFAMVYDSLLVSQEEPWFLEYSLSTTQEIGDFKTYTTQGLIECKIKAIMLPLFTDHLLREANYYIQLLLFNELT